MSDVIDQAIEAGWQVHSDPQRVSEEWKARVKSAHSNERDDVVVPDPLVDAVQQSSRVHWSIDGDGTIKAVTK